LTIQIAQVSRLRRRDDAPRRGLRPLAQQLELNNKMKVSEIFEEEPIQWGLRGGQFLWRELKKSFKNIEMPETSEQPKALIEKEYEVSTGHPITHEKNFGV